MPAKMKRDAARNELVRLLKGLDFYRDWQISLRQLAHGSVSDEDLKEIVEPGSTFLELFDRLTGNDSMCVLREVQHWYAHAFGDLTHFSSQGGEEVEAEIRRFLTAFRTEVGFDFRAEAGIVKKTANRVLSRRSVAREEEYHMLKELENDLSQMIVSRDELAAISDLLRKFETR